MAGLLSNAPSATDPGDLVTLGEMRAAIGSVGGGAGTTGAVVPPVGRYLNPAAVFQYTFARQQIGRTYFHPIVVGPAGFPVNAFRTRIVEARSGGTVVRRAGIYRSQPNGLPDTTALVATATIDDTAATDARGADFALDQGAVPLAPGTYWAAMHYSGSGVSSHALWLTINLAGYALGGDDQDSPESTAKGLVLVGGTDLPTTATADQDWSYIRTPETPALFLRRAAGDLILPAAATAAPALTIPRPPVGFWGQAYGAANGTATGASTGGLQMFHPFALGPDPWAMDALTVVVTTARVGGTAAMLLGVYADLDGYPDTSKLLARTTVSMDATGAPIGVLDAIVRGRAMVWMSSLYVVTNAPTTAPQFRIHAAPSWQVPVQNPATIGNTRGLSLSGRSTLIETAQAPTAFGAISTGIMPQIAARRVAT